MTPSRSPSRRRSEAASGGHPRLRAGTAALEGGFVVQGHLEVSARSGPSRPRLTRRGSGRSMASCLALPRVQRYSQRIVQRTEDTRATVQDMRVDHRGVHMVTGPMASSATPTAMTAPVATKLRRERRAESSILVFMAVSVSAVFGERLLMPSLLLFVCGSARAVPATDPTVVMLKSQDPGILARGPRERPGCPRRGPDELPSASARPS